MKATLNKGNWPFCWEHCHFCHCLQGSSFSIIFSLHHLLSLCSTTTTIFLFFLFLCFNVATCIHSLHRLWYHLFKLVVLLPFQAWHFFVVLNTFVSFIVALKLSSIFGASELFVFVSSFNYNIIIVLKTLFHSPPFQGPFCFVELFSFFVCNLFLQGSICFCFYNTFFWNCRFGQRPFMNNYLK